MNKKYIWRSSFLVLLLIFITTSITFAEIEYSDYGVATYESGDIYGGRVSTTLKSLNGAWSSTNNKNFAVMGMWLNLMDTNWIEAGFGNGGFKQPFDSSPSYYNGWYTALGNYTQRELYQEWKINGPSTTLGTNHSLQIVTSAYGSNTWYVYIDGTLYKSFNTIALDPIGMSMWAGFETNNSSSSSDT